MLSALLVCFPLICVFFLTFLPPVMYDLITTILANEKEICHQSMSDTGKTLFEAEFGEILTR